MRFHDDPTSPTLPSPPSPKYNGGTGGSGSTLDSGVGSAEYPDPLYGLMGETYLDRYFARKGMLGSGGVGTSSSPIRTRSKLT